MKIWNILPRTHLAREFTNDVATGSVNTDAPDLAIEVLRVVDRQISYLGMEVEVFYNGADAIIWKLSPRMPEKIPDAHKDKVPKVDKVSSVDEVVRSGEKTSAVVASKAAALLRMDNDDIRANIDSEEFVSSLRSIAASALTQKE